MTEMRYIRVGIDTGNNRNTGRYAYSPRFPTVAYGHGKDIRPIWNSSYTIGIL